MTLLPRQLAALASILTVPDLADLIGRMVFARLDSHPDSPDAGELAPLINASIALRQQPPPPPEGPDHG